MLCISQQCLTGIGQVDIIQILYEYFILLLPNECDISQMGLMQGFQTTLKRLFFLKLCSHRYRNPELFSAIPDKNTRKANLIGDCCSPVTSQAQSVWDSWIASMCD